MKFNPSRLIVSIGALVSMLFSIQNLVLGKIIGYIVVLIISICMLIISLICLFINARIRYKRPDAKTQRKIYQYNLIELIKQGEISLFISTLAFLVSAIATSIATIILHLG